MIPLHLNPRNISAPKAGDGRWYSDGRLLELAQTTMQSSVSQYGITWYFDGDYEVGQYVNGDYFVVGKDGGAGDKTVTIINITPESETIDDPDSSIGERTINGSMLAGTEVNSFDNFDNQTVDGGSSGENPLGNYDSTNNVAPGYTGQPLVVSEETIWSCASMTRQEILDQEDSGRPVLWDMALLTVVSEKPLDGAFRPNPYTKDKTHLWNEIDLDWSILRNLAHPSSAKTFDEMADQIEGVWYNRKTGWENRPFGARNLQERFQGINYAYYNSEAVIHLHMDGTQSQKRRLFVNIVQRGLDLYGRYVAAGGENSSGYIWSPNGAHAQGRTMPMAMAALALDDNNIKTAIAGGINSVVASDRGQVRYVDQGYVDNSDYLEKDIGLPIWGIRAWTDKYRNVTRPWGGQSYFYTRFGIWSQIAVAHLTPGMREAWDYEPVFDFADVVDEIDTHNGSFTIGGPTGAPPVVRDMWNMYRDQYGEPRFDWDLSDWKE